MRTFSVPPFVNANVSAAGLLIKVFVSLAKPNTLSSGILMCSDDVQESVASIHCQVLSPSPDLTVIPPPSAAASFAAPMASSITK